MQRVVVATDRSQTAERAVAWAGELAGRYDAELVIVQVIPAENGEVDIAEAEASLLELARELAGERGRARVRIDPDPPRAIVDAAIDEGADVLVVGNVGHERAARSSCSATSRTGSRTTRAAPS